MSGQNLHNSQNSVERRTDEAVSDTPKTDRFEYEQECNFDVPWEDRCRELERENNRLRADLQSVAECAYNNRSHQTMRDTAWTALNSVHSVNSVSQS